jgi:CheY-like chemotaxis protein
MKLLPFLRPNKARRASALSRRQNREAFDVLLSDIGLPDGDGCEIMTRIRAVGSMPGIAISGYGMAGHRG